MKKTIKQSARMKYFSTLAGSVKNLPKGKTYRVEYSSLLSFEHAVYRYWTRIIAYGAIIIIICFELVLFKPDYWIIIQQPDSPLDIANAVMLLCLFWLQVMVLIGAVSSTRATLRARNPIPVRPQRNLRVAFVTTRAPGEPIDMVKTTLEAIKRVHKSGAKVDVWLLDETNEPELIKICASLGVNHFSRAGVERWNTPKYKRSYFKICIKSMVWLFTLGKKDISLNKPDPFYAAKSKHGNFNSWRAYLKENEMSYDILAGVDTDHVPELNYLQRLLGYFRDEDVAYVVGPQVYGNYGPGISRLVARLAESQASFFQGTIQRAGNSSNSAMFVGTNYAVRMDVLDQINGFQPCITEDMATGLAVHTRKNPKSGNTWKSVYTPDVVAVGEGPDLWGPFFTQQWRWAAGTFDTWRKVVWKDFYKLSFSAMVHYFLILTYYPITALTWILGVVSSMVYLITGATAILAPWSEFLTLYLMVLVMQLSLYFWNRRYNVSPHEPVGSYGVGGMFASTLMSPIYFSALLGILMGKKPNFVVTAKGGSSSFDNIRAFNTHIRWALILSAGLIYGYIKGNDHPAMLIWSGILLIVCITPVVLGMYMPIKQRMSSPVRVNHRRLSTAERDRSYV